MTAFKSLVIQNGTTKQIPDADSLLVGTGIDRNDTAPPGTLTIGGTNATSVTLGSATIPVNIPGDVTTVGGTTFTTDATFEGNVTFGAGAADTVTFAASTTVVSDIAFGGAPGTYKITNLANGTAPNDAVNKSQLDALVVGVSSFQTSLSGLTPSSATGGAITLAGTLGVASGGTGATTLTSGSLLAGNGTGAVAEIAPGANGQVLTVVSGAWASAAAAVTATAQGGANAVQYANATTPADFDGDNTKLAFNESTSQLSVGTGTANETLTVNGRVSIAEGAVPTNTAGFGKLWAESVDKTLHFYDNSIDYLVTPNTVATLTYAASVALDFSPSLPPIKSVTLTGDIAFTSTNLGASRNISVRVVGDTVSRNLTSFPAGWKWLGGVTPTVLEANKVAILSLASFSNNDANVVASWSYDGSDVVTDVTASAPLASSGGATPNISLTGVVGVTNGGTGQSSYVNGELLIGNSTGNTLTKSTLTAGSGVSITNGAGSITISSTGAAAPVIDLTTTGLTAGDVAYVASNDTAGAAIATATSTARCAGFVSVVGGAGTGKVQVGNVYAGANFITGLTGLAAGQPVYLSKTAGKLTNDVSAFTTGDVVAEVGITTSVSSATGGAAAASVLWQPKSITVL